MSSNRYLLSNTIIFVSILCGCSRSPGKGVEFPHPIVWTVECGHASYLGVMTLEAQPKGAAIKGADPTSRAYLLAINDNGLAKSPVLVGEFPEAIIECFALSETGKYAVIRTMPLNLYVVATDSGEILWSENGAFVINAHLSEEESILWTAEQDPAKDRGYGGSVIGRDALSGRILHTLAQSDSTPEYLDISAKDGCVGITDRDGHVVVRSIPNGVVIDEFFAMDESDKTGISPWHIDFSDDGSRLCVSGVHGWVVRNLRQSKSEFAQFSRDGKAWHMSFAEGDSGQIVGTIWEPAKGLAYSRMSVCRYDLSDGRCIYVGAGQKVKGPATTTLSLSGDRLIFAKDRELIFVRLDQGGSTGSLKTGKKGK